MCRAGAWFESRCLAALHCNVSLVAAHSQQNGSAWFYSNSGAGGNCLWLEEERCKGGQRVFTRTSPVLDSQAGHARLLG